MTNDGNNSPPKPGILRRIIDQYLKLGTEYNHISQALVILSFCAVAGLIFILFYALQIPYQMTLGSNTTSITEASITNVSITHATNIMASPTLTIWDSLFIVISVFGAGFMVSGASFFLGGFLGFLFGIPKTIKRTTQNGGFSPPSKAKPDSYTANTNLEDISDWLTKIIIGVGLVELTQIPQFFTLYAGMIAPALGGIPSSGAFGISILVFYSLIGFLFIYLTTRGYMENELENMKRKELNAVKMDTLKEEANLDKLRIEGQVEQLKMEIKENEERRLRLERSIKQDQEKWIEEDKQKASVGEVIK